ncbi:MAG TPA: hypothetical protein VIV60_02530, partial [Polyangiaceae bacterium]
MSDIGKGHSRWVPKRRCHLTCHGARAALGAALCTTLLVHAVEKRPLPNYDGRAKQPTPEQVAWWFPRLLLSPAYFVSEFVIRRPLGYAITAAERAELPGALYDFFAFGPDHKAGIVPVAFVDFGFNPSVGVYSFWDDAGFRGNDLRLSGSTWGSDWLAGTFTDRIRYGAHRSLTLTASAIRRPDYAFYGIGPAPKESERSRYGADKADIRVISRTYFWGASSVESTLGYRAMTFYRGHYENEPSVTDRVRDQSLPLPPGFDSGYRAVFSALQLAVDSRPRTGASKSGARVEVQSEQGSDFRGTSASGWL